MNLRFAMLLPLAIISVLLVVLALQGVMGSNWDTVAPLLAPFVLLIAFLGFILSFLRRN